MNSVYINLPHEIEKKLISSSFQKLADSLEGTTYAINRPLDPYFSDPDYSSAAIVCFPGKRILLINCSSDKTAFDDYVEDLKFNLNFLCRSKEYDKLLGNIRNWWSELFCKIEFDEFCDIESCFRCADIAADEYGIKKKAELVVSLLTASYNDVSHVCLDLPGNLLDAVKNKIMLFDTDQSKFLFSDDPGKKKIVIQGMAGTGKTELLLHKLKNAYVGDRDSRICFTCFNKVLLSKLKERIPAFFNIMRVSEQIAWNERLFVMSSWGSARDKYSGLYAYICNYFGMPFLTYDETRNRKTIWEETLRTLEEANNSDYLFDYMFVDEAQDFPDAFFEVCERITRKKVIVGLDVFQDIFIQRDSFESLPPTILLKKCYRTDPLTLMFAHALCLGSLDNKPLSYLSDEELELCGYQHSVVGNKLKLKREPIHRFFESGKNTRPISMIPVDQGIDGAIVSTLNIIENLKEEFPNLQPKDLCIVFLDRYGEVAAFMDKIGFKIQERFGWPTNSAVNTKVVNESVFITNRNNVKGLEFPFVITIISGTIGKTALGQRNTIYMALTRSFLRSYLVIDGKKNESILADYQPCIEQLERDGFLLIPYLDEEQAKKVQKRLSSIQSGEFRLETIVRKICYEESVPDDKIEEVVSFIKSHRVENQDEEQITEKARTYIRLIK